MPGATLIGSSEVNGCDMGLDCCPHGRAGTNGSGSSDVIIDGKGVHLNGDTGPCNCPHGGTFKSVESSSTVFANNKGITFIGNKTVCNGCGLGGSHVTGSSDVIIGK